jgi:hypothetical protein
MAGVTRNQDNIDLCRRRIAAEAQKDQIAGRQWLETVGQCRIVGIVPPSSRQFLALL